MDILTALGQLDTLNDEHWTAEGAPRMDVLIELTGNKELIRKSVTEVAPLFTRENTELKPKEEEPAPSQEPPVAKTDEEEQASLDLGNDPEPAAQVQYDDENPEHLRARLAGFDEALADAKEEVADAQKHLVRVQAEGDRIRDKLNVLDPNPSNQDAIGTYLASQHRLRAEKYATRKQILGGLTLKDVQAKAPIDEAMSRKNTRGTARPVRTA